MDQKQRQEFNNAVSPQGRDKFNFGDLDVRTELATLAANHLPISQCAGGHQIAASGPCDHCGSPDPSNQCNFVNQVAQFGIPLQTK